MSAFHARILASDTLFFDGDCEFMVVPCTDGAMGILSHHSNMIAAVVPGELRFQPVGGPLRTAAVSAGLVKVEAGEVMLLVSTAERPEDIDVNRARRAEVRDIRKDLDLWAAFPAGAEDSQFELEDRKIDLGILLSVVEKRL